MSLSITSSCRDAFGGSYRPSEIHRLRTNQPCPAPWAVPTLFRAGDRSAFAYAAAAVRVSRVHSAHRRTWVRRRVCHVRILLRLPSRIRRISFQVCFQAMTDADSFPESNPCRRELEQSGPMQDQRMTSQGCFALPRPVLFRLLDSVWPPRNDLRLV